MKKETTQPEHFWIDLFCGAGGVTSGIVMSGCGKVIACVNHDKNAIESHKANHPDVLHFVEDIRVLELQPLVNLVKQLRRDQPGCIIHLWASLECTNHSNAKGGLSRDEDSRTLDKTLYMKWDSKKGEFVEGDSYMQLLDPDYLWIENVREFKKSGPLMIKQGKTSEGYPFSHLHYNKKKKKFEPHMIPIKERKGEFYDEFVNRVKGLGYDFDDRIFNCADFGMRTIRKRLFIQFPKKGLPLVWPEPTHNKNGTGGKKKWLPVRDILDFKDTGESIFNRKKPLVEKTLERIYAGLEKFIANGKPQFIYKALGNNEKTGINNGCDVNDPSITVTTQNRLYLMNAAFLVNQNHSSKTADPNLPSPSVLTKDKYSVVNPDYIMNPIWGNKGSSVDEPMSTVTASRRHRHYMVNPQYASPGGSIDDPSFTLIARMDKMPPYLVTTQEGYAAIEITEHDSYWTRKIKIFMAAFGIIDIYMRMLKIIELLQIQDFPVKPKRYVLKGTVTEQKKYIGNAVPRRMVRALVRANFRAINSIQHRKRKTA